MESTRLALVQWTRHTIAWIRRDRRWHLFLWLAILIPLLWLGAETTPRTNDVIYLRDEFAGPARGRAITMNPGADIKRRLLAIAFDYRQPVNANIDDRLAAKQHVEAYLLAYLQGNQAKMQKAALRAGASGDHGSAEDEWDQYAFVRAIDGTLFFEAYAWERLGNRAQALRKYSQYSAVLRDLGPIDLDPSFKNISRRQTIVRVKIFQLKKGLEGRTPFITRQLESFFSAFQYDWPYKQYDDAFAALRPSANHVEERITAPRSQIEDFDRCLEVIRPHGGDWIEEAASNDCHADRFAGRWGYDFLSAILEFDQMHRALAHPAAIDGNGEIPAKPPQPNKVSFAQVMQFLENVRRYAPEATFLDDDLIQDFLFPEPAENAGYVQPNLGWSGLSLADRKTLLCATRVTAPANARIFDKQPELANQAGRIGITCN